MPFESDRREFLLTAGAVGVAVATEAGRTQPISWASPAWVRDVTRMGFLTPGEVARAAGMGVQVVHTNLIWPYFPLRRDGGGLSKDDDRKLRDLVTDCQKHRLRLVLGLPPFPPVSLVEKHPDWRIHPQDSDAVRKIPPRENDLGTRSCCNLGPWGDYLIDLCGELVDDYGLDGFSFDGNYHPPVCFCPACKKAYPRLLPPRANLDDLAYREYLVWRGERLVDHYTRMQQRIKKARPDAVLISWTVNAGRYGHFLHSPRAMPIEVNRVFDLPMQEWWLDETNIGSSIVPTFGAMYLRAVAGDRPCAAEPYLMSRGNPYGTDSFPAHERRTRCFLAVSCGNILAESLGWPGHDPAEDFRDIAQLEGFMKNANPLPWAALLVSEQTRQFHAYKDIAQRFLPHALGAFRACVEGHLPVNLITDLDLKPDALAPYSVVVLPNAAALSDRQCAALRAFVHAGGGLIATGETSLCDEVGRTRKDFALADLLGMSFRGRNVDEKGRPMLDENFARALDDDYWKQRTGLAHLTWGDHAICANAKLRALVPIRSVRFKGPIVRVSEPVRGEDVVGRVKPEGVAGVGWPGIIARPVGKGRVVFLAAALDAALWSYAYPYQRMLLCNAIHWAARTIVPIQIAAPMCVQATYFTQKTDKGRRYVVHLFNSVNTTAGHGMPSAEVPLREETIPIHNIDVRFRGVRLNNARWMPRDDKLDVRQDGNDSLVRVPELGVHGILAAR